MAALTEADYFRSLLDAESAEYRAEPLTREGLDRWLYTARLNSLWSTRFGFRGSDNLLHFDIGDMYIFSPISEIDWGEVKPGEAAIVYKPMESEE